MRVTDKKHSSQSAGKPAGFVHDDLNEDTCIKLVRYSRASMIGNEKQTLALFLAASTALSNDPCDYASTGIVGELGSGKTKLVKVILGEAVTKGSKIKPKHRGLFPDGIKFHFTSGSRKATIYSRSLREENGIRMIEASEYQKLEPSQIEYFKAQSGDDPMFAYEFVDMASRDTERIEQPKRWFVFTYAQVEMDPELKSRMLMFSVEENKLINKCVNAMNHGRKFAEYRGVRYTLKGDPETEEELRMIVEGVLDECQKVKVANPFDGAFDDLEDCARASSKRTSRMIESLFQSSARVNYLNRERDEDDNIIMSAQDVVNVLAFADILQSMILEIDTIDLAIIRYLSLAGEAMTSTSIINAVSDSGLAELKGTELLRRISKLENDNYVIASAIDQASKKQKWYLNRRKYIHPITVYWEKIFDVDSGPVTEPITGEEFGDILEYGDWFQRTFRTGLDQQDVSSQAEEDTEDMKIRLSVERVIAGGAEFKTIDDLAHAVRNQLGCRTLDAFDTTNLINVVISQMVAEKAIDLNSQRGCFVRIDPSLRTAMKQQPIPITTNAGTRHHAKRKR